MNEDMTAYSHDGSAHADTTTGALTTDFSQVVSYAAGNDRDARRREKIRAELVREYFAEGQINREQRASPTTRSFLLKLFKID